MPRPPQPEETTTQSIVRLLRGGDGCLNCHAKPTTTAGGHVAGIRPEYGESQGGHVRCESCGQVMALTASRRKVVKIGSPPPTQTI